MVSRLAIRDMPKKLTPKAAVARDVDLDPTVTLAAASPPEARRMFVAVVNQTLRGYLDKAAETYGALSTLINRLPPNHTARAIYVSGVDDHVGNSGILGLVATLAEMTSTISDARTCRLITEASNLITELNTSYARDAAVRDAINALGQPTQTPPA